MKHLNTVKSSALIAILAFSGAISTEVYAQPGAPGGGLTCGISGATVTHFAPAKRKDGSTIPAQFVNTANALGAPQNLDNAEGINYVSLGFGGEIVVELTDRLSNNTGMDFRVSETTFAAQNCTRYPEKAEVYVSQDGCNFVCLGITCQDGSFDLAGSGLEWIKFVKLHDISPLSHPYGNDMLANGYDLDGISCLSSVTAPSAPGNTTFTPGNPRTFENYLPANPNSIPLSRRNPLNATGVPENNNGTPITFTSLGFGGEITLNFDYVVFDNEGPDLFVTETSGSVNYPEKAEFYGSACGSQWVLLGNTEDGSVLTQDGWIDLSGNLYSLKYLRIIDRSKRSQFPANSDGYDVDGITVINGSNCNGGSNSNARIYQIENNVPDEAGAISVYPNPFSNSATFNYMGGSASERVTLTVYNMTGQRVAGETFQVADNQMTSKTYDFSHLPAGLYFLEVAGAEGKEIHKLIKN